MAPTAKQKWRGKCGNGAKNGGPPRPNGSEAGAYPHFFFRLPPVPDTSAVTRAGPALPDRCHLFKGSLWPLAPEAAAATAHACIAHEWILQSKAQWRLADGISWWSDSPVPKVNGVVGFALDQDGRDGDPGSR